MRRRVREHAEAPGQDSFLDVVANLVGIMIILVMIVGARARDALVQAEQTPPPAPAIDAEVEASRNAAVAVRHDLDTMLAESERQQIEIAYRRNERDRILLLISAVEQAMAAETAKLSDEQQKAHAMQGQLVQLQQQKEDLKRALEAVERTEASVTVLKHRPTPLAKTVFGKEVHFRLQGGRIVYVPIDELVDLFKGEAREKAWKLKQAPRITEMIGPYRGFQMQYTLKRGTFTMETRTGTVQQSLVELDNFVLYPVQEGLGETFEEAMQPDSELRSILAGYDPNQATVTVWVYPDSFEFLRLLKEDLFKLGYLTASRPMPEGQPISGSPQGTRSTAQ